MRYWKQTERRQCGISQEARVFLTFWRLISRFSISVLRLLHLSSTCFLLYSKVSQLFSSSTSLTSVYYTIMVRSLFVIWINTLLDNKSGLRLDVLSTQWCYIISQKWWEVQSPVCAMVSHYFHYNHYSSDGSGLI